MTQNKSKKKMMGEQTEKNSERDIEISTENRELKGERNARFLPIFYWTD